MSYEPRQGKAYIWPTWIASLISSDKSCQWSAWFRAHFQYDKRPQENENSLLVWKTEHAAMVRETEALLRAQGYGPVTVEDQNKFTYHGKAATVGGKPDLVGLRDIDFGDAPRSSAVIVDCKSGKERDSDVVQVLIYMLLAPHDIPALRGRTLRGQVVYRSRVHEVGEDDLGRMKDAIIAQVQRTAADEEPRRTPSAGECKHCDILDCPDRIVASAADVLIEPLEGALF